MSSETGWLTKREIDSRLQTITNKLHKRLDENRRILNDFDKRIDVYIEEFEKVNDVVEEFNNKLTDLDRWLVCT